MWNVIIANIRSEMSRYFACTTFTSNLFRCTERKGAREKHSSEVIAMLKNGFPLVRHWIPCLGLEYFVNPRFVFARTNTKRSSLNDPAPHPHLTECNLNHFPLSKPTHLAWQMQIVLKDETTFSANDIHKKENNCN